MEGFEADVSGLTYINVNSSVVSRDDIVQLIVALYDGTGGLHHSNGRRYQARVIQSIEDPGNSSNQLITLESGRTFSVLKTNDVSVAV